MKKINRSRIKEYLDSGYSKMDIYELLRIRFNEKDLRLKLASFPSPHLFPPLNRLNILVVFIWVLYLIVDLSVTLARSVVAESFAYPWLFLAGIILFVKIVEKNGYFYFPSAIWFGCTLIYTIVEDLDMHHTRLDNEKGLYLDLMIIGFDLLLIVGIGLMLYIRFRIFHFYNWFY